SAQIELERFRTYGENLFLSRKLAVIMAWYWIRKRSSSIWALANSCAPRCDQGEEWLQSLTLVQCLRESENEHSRNAMDKLLTKRPKPLEGLRVLELGQLLAGPFASLFLAWFGAEVIKVEPPVIGDPLRTWRALHNGTALWWYILGRNKKCITLNLRTPKGQEIVRRLV